MVKLHLRFSPLTSVKFKVQQQGFSLALNLGKTLEKKLHSHTLSEQRCLKMCHYCTMVNPQAALGCKLKNHFLLNFLAFSLFCTKFFEKAYFDQQTSVWSAQHPIAGQNIHHIFRSFVIISIILFLLISLLLNLEPVPVLSNSISNLNFIFRVRLRRM